MISPRLIHSFRLCHVLSSQSLCKPEQLCQLLLRQFRADHADTARIFRRAGAHLMLSGNHVKIDPFPGFSCDHSFCAEYIAINTVLFKFLKNI